MNIDKKDRAQLKTYFVKNSIPKESEFAELIDGMLNQKDDGIAKPPGEPLSIQAIDAAGIKKVINFYTDFKEASAWSLSLNTPDPANPATLKTGFSINDGDNNRLFIDKNTGNVGIGTIAPDAKLTVAGTLRVDSQIYAGNSDIYFTNTELNSTAIGDTTGYAAIQNAKNYDALMILGRAGTDKGRKVKLWDYLQVNGTMEATGTIIPSAGNGNNGIVFPSNPGGGGGDTAWIKYYSRNPAAADLPSKEQMTLEIGVANDANDHIALMPSGNVGIGTTTPGAKLDINATTTTWDGWLEAIRFSRTEHSAITLPGGNLLFGMHGINRTFYFSDTKGTGKHVMQINAETGNVGIGTNAPVAKLSVIGTGLIGDGTNVAVRDGRMISGSLTIGSTITSYGGGSGWNPNTAGLMLETLANTEIAVHDASNRISSLMYYEGDAANRITIGRDMGWGAIGSVVIKGDLVIQGNLSVDKSVSVFDRLLSKSGVVDGKTPPVFVIGPFFPSDINLKKDIEELQYGLEQITHLRPVSFNWKEGTNSQKNLGLIAQEVQGIIDEIVYSDDSPEGNGTLSLAYTSLIPVLINAIKELDAKIKRLESSAVTG